RLRPLPCAITSPVPAALSSADPVPGAAARAAPLPLGAAAPAVGLAVVGLAVVAAPAVVAPAAAPAAVAALAVVAPAAAPAVVAALAVVVPPGAAPGARAAPAAVPVRSAAPGPAVVAALAAVVPARGHAVAAADRARSRHRFAHLKMAHWLRVGPDAAIPFRVALLAHSAQTMPARFAVARPGIAESALEIAASALAGPDSAAALPRHAGDTGNSGFAALAAALPADTDPLSIVAGTLAAEPLPGPRCGSNGPIPYAVLPTNGPNVRPILVAHSRSTRESMPADAGSSAPVRAE